ncbi:DUF2799 domain-containing protein [Vibrio cholerae]
MSALKRTITPVGVFVALLITGCTTVTTPTSNVDQDWYQFGVDRGENGLLNLSQSKLAKADEAGYLNDDRYAAYLAGYEQGRGQYCQQNAYMLGVMGKPYYGVCDRLDPFFQQDYVSGRTSTAGSGF